MPRKLTDLEVDEISLVDNPANVQARVLIFKRDGDAPAPEGDDLVCKCLGAIEREDLESISKADIEAAMDHLAEKMAAEKRIGFHKAYVQMLDTHEGMMLYAGLDGVRVAEMMNRLPTDPAA